MSQKDHIGPYQIDERLGSGGMGEVYKAHDARLDRWVAIKRIRPDKEQSADSRERFRREARATAKLSHAAIVHVYDIFSDADADCIVMEYVDGRGLDEIIADEGPLDAHRVAALARQIAEGLAEAHEKGLMHRDLKTENILVNQSGHAKILDFGLAKPIIKDELDDSLTGKGQVVGTSRAMSPEYVSGDEIDHRSDLFALGVLLYEMATSQSPFKAHNTLATLKRVILHRQAPVHEVNPLIPLELSRLIDQLLEKEPEDRPQSAAETAAALATMTAGTSSGSIERPGFGFTSSMEMQALSSRRPWPWIGVAAIALIVAVAAVLWVLYRPNQPRIQFEERDRVVLADIVNNTDDPLWDDVLRQLFESALNQSTFAQLVPPAVVNDTLERMEAEAGTQVDRAVALEVARRENARAVIIGYISNINERYLLTAEVVDPESEAVVLSQSLEGENRDAVIGVVQRLTRDLRRDLGESLASIEKTSLPLERVTTSSYDALVFYSQGTRASSPDTAVSLLSQAIEIDPEFAMAHARLGTVYRNLGRNSSTILRHFDAALENRNRLTQSEQLYIEGWRALINNEPPITTMEKWRLLSNLYPELYEGHHNLGMILWVWFHDFEGAAQAFERATETGGEQRWVAYKHLGFMRMALGQIGPTREAFETSMQFNPQGQLGDYLYPAILERNYDEAETMAVELGPDQDGTILESRYIAALDQGNLEEALSWIDQQLDSPPQVTNLPRHIQIGEVTAIESLVLLGRTDEALAKLRAAVETAQSYPDSEPSYSVALALASLGKQACRLGEVELATELAEIVVRETQKSRFAIHKAYRLVLLAEIELARGRAEQSKELLRESLDTIETIQAHESLARTHEALGEIEEAIAAYQWLADHRGRAFVECQDVCIDRPTNLVRTDLALERIGALSAELGRNDEALVATQEFLDFWQANGESIPLWRQARIRAQELLSNDT
ncbi:MAG: protein kinase [Acidobacteriota bacterium]